MIIPFLLTLNHFFADFFCQTDKMAINKSTSNKWLTIHVLTYMIAFFPFVLYMEVSINGWNWSVTDSPNALLWWFSNGVLHWITDFFTSRLTSYLYVRGEKNPKELFMGHSWRHWFFTAIGGDQVIHYFCLFFTYQYFIS